ncbi:quinone-dependent dihydroorotate dehydrogenase [Alteraurantiacibacter buctensis]|uniref:Dihydroorotate dehydrogenase (quinone) n=1 Tax=Alteraurantiacibacter buctensis TaxID=1503981 RepID=A0A844YSF2_9SPHN|nr:quinone-dependent dihydroorotate dehydrogenase [Alteraurantiacibacter buctensis]MXO70479.1 quinone-dependent dihydroorotate dehydrogenase [Alteraurantiacibacter buctensis]
MLFRLLRPAIFALDPERAHGISLAALKLLPEGAPAAPDGPLASQVAGIAFANPVGMAAGYDKDAEVPDALLGLGFGFAEVGSITPRPQTGNPKPRLFRLAEDEAVINRMGFNNGGMAAARDRLATRKRQGVLGINVGANKDAADRVADYITGIRTFAPLADYLTVNISSPNTPGLRDLQGDRELANLLGAIAAERQAGDPPVFLKVAPDLDPDAPGRIVEAVVKHGLAGIIVSNTTISRPPLHSPHAGEAGGLSGAPLRDLALQRLRDFRAVAGDAVPLIGVGGIATAQDAWARIRAGASLIQLYSAMVYRGPGIARQITAGLERLMSQYGFDSIAAAVGTE